MSVLLGDAVVHITGSDKGLSNSLDSAQRKTQGFISNLGGVLNNAIGVALGNTINAGFAKINQAMRDLAATGIQAVAANERLTLSLESLSASQLRAGDSTISMAQALEAATPIARELLGWINELAIKSPFDQEGVAKAYQTAAAYGFTTTMAKRLTQAEIDFAAATGAGTDAMNRVALALGQISARGTATAQDLNQLREVGAPVQRALESMGKTIDDVSNGLVSASDFTEALVSIMESDFAGAAERQSTTWAGLGSTLSDLMKINVRSFFEGILTPLQPVVAKLVELASSRDVTAALTELGQAISDILRPGLEWLGGVLESLPEKFRNLAGFIRQLRDELSGITAEQILAELPDRIKGIQDQLVKSLDVLAQAHQGTLDKLQASIVSAGDEMAQKLTEISEKYAPKIADINERFSRSIRSIQERITDSEEQSAKRRQDVEKRRVEVSKRLEESLTELKREHERKRRDLVMNMLTAETEEQWLAAKQAIEAEDTKFRESTDKAKTAAAEQKVELESQEAEQEEASRKQTERLKRSLAEEKADREKALQEVFAERDKEIAKVEETHQQAVKALEARIQAENENYQQQVADLKAATDQQLKDTETQAIARAAAIGKGMAHTIATFIKDVQASFNAEGFSGVLDMLIVKAEQWATANQDKLQGFGETIGRGIANGILAIPVGDLFSGRLSEQIRAGIRAYMDIGGEIAGATATGLIEGLTGVEVSQQITDALANVWRGVIQTIITTLFPSLGVLFAQEQYNQIKTAFEGMSWGEIGAAIWEGITGGLAEAAGGVRDDVEEAGSDLLDGIKDFFGIDSPSKLFRDQVGAQLAAGLGQGFQAGMGDVARKAQDALKGLTPGRLQPALATIRPVSLQQTNYLPAAPNGFDREGLMNEINQRTLKLLLEMENA